MFEWLREFLLVFGQDRERRQRKPKTDDQWAGCMVAEEMAEAGSVTSAMRGGFE